MLKTSEVIWKSLAPIITPEKIGEGWENMRPEILVPLYRVFQELPEYYGLWISGAYREGKGAHGEGLAVDIELSNGNSKETSLKGSINILDGIIKRLEFEKLIALGIYTEGENDRCPGFHLEAEKEERPTPRRWGVRYKRNEDGSLFMRDEKPIKERIAYEAALKMLGSHYRV